MEVKINKLPKSQIELEIEISAGEFKQFIDKASQSLGKDLEIKGFRKGRAPKEIVKEKVGGPNILVEAADLAIKENYRKAVLENKIEAVSGPEIDILKLARGDSFKFRVKIPVLPEIKLPDYKKIASGVKRRKVSVAEKEVESSLKWLQKSRAKLTLKQEPAQIGDFVEIEYWSPGIGDEKGQKDAFILSEGHFIPRFEEQLIGMKIGEEKEGISLTVPEKHFRKDLAGKKIVLKVKMNSVQKIELPEINDGFCQKLGKFKDLAAFKNSIKEGISLEKERAEIQRVRAEILEKISEKTKCEAPETLIENEQKRILERFKNNIASQFKISFKDYLAKLNKTEKQVVDSFRLQAEKQIRAFLILREIAKIEAIEVSEEEIKQELNKSLKYYPNIKETEKKLAHQNPASLRGGGTGGLDLNQLKEYTKEGVKNEKTFKLLESLVSL